MKSISFNVPGIFDKIIDGSKTCTIRGLYIPQFTEGEIIILKERLGEWSEKKFGRTLLVKVGCVKPIRLKNITDAIALKEGFSSATESIAWLIKQYQINDENRWLFVIMWRKPKNPQKTLEEFSDDIKK
jgi:hypothetical protein